MYPYIHIILPSYAVLAFIGGFCVLLYVYLHLDTYQIAFTTFLKLFILCVAGGFIGSKLLFAFTKIPWLIQNFSLQNLILLIPQSGYVFYGGLFGVIVTVLLCTRREKENRRIIFQLMAPAIPLFHGFGRIGCFLAGCCYGKKCEVPFVWRSLEIDRIPVQLLEAVYEFLLFIVLVIVSKKKPEVDMLRIYLIAYAVFRFINEFFRGDVVRGIFVGISTAQWISIGIVLFYSCLSLRKKRKKYICKKM